MRSVVLNVLNAFSAKEIESGNYLLDKKDEKAVLSLLDGLRLRADSLSRHINIQKINTEAGGIISNICEQYSGPTQCPLSGDAYVISWNESTISSHKESVYEKLPQEWGEPQYGWKEYDIADYNTISDGIITLYFR